MTATTTTPETAWPAVKITATHITLLQLARTAKGTPSNDAALVQYLDGSTDVIPSLTDEPASPSVRILRSPGRQWADDLVAGFREQYEDAGAPIPPLGTLRAMAGREATQELLAEAKVAALSAIREAAADDLLDEPEVEAGEAASDPSPAPVRPALVPELRRRGRHAAQPTEATLAVEAELRWAFTLDVLEADEPVAA